MDLPDSCLASLPSGVKNMVAGMCITEMILSLILNSLNFFYILFYQKTRRRNDFYLAFLSLMMIAIDTILIFDLKTFIDGEWRSGVVTCKITAFILEFVITMSTMMLLWISFDQYYFIFHPAEYKKRFTNVNTNIIATTIGITIFCLPYPIIYQTRYDECMGITCYGDGHGSTVQKTFFSIQIIIVYFIPIIVILGFYIKIILFLNAKNKMEACLATVKSDITTENNPTSTTGTTGGGKKEKQSKSLKVKKTLISMLIVFGFFVLTWTPFVVNRFIDVFNRRYLNEYFVRAAQGIWMLNQVLYPVIFTLSNKRMREDVKAIFKKIFTRR